MAQAGVRGEGLRWPSAGFRREPVVFFPRPFAFPCVCQTSAGGASHFSPARQGWVKVQKIVSTVGAAPNQKHISDQTRFRVSSTTQQTPHVLPLSQRSDVKTCKRSDVLRACHRSSQSMVGHVTERLPPARFSELGCGHSPTAFC